MSFVSTPMKSTPRLFILRYTRSNCGVSDLHGVHHAAQKLMTTTLPRVVASEVVPPSSRVPVNEPACLRSAIEYSWPSGVPEWNSNVLLPLWSTASLPAHPARARTAASRRGRARFIGSSVRHAVRGADTGLRACGSGPGALAAGERGGRLGVVDPDDRVPV